MIVVSGCSIQKHLLPEQKLYGGAKFSISADSSISKSQIEKVKVELEEITRPIPNTSVLGIKYKIKLYYLFGNTKKEEGFRASFRKKYGEKPVLITPNMVNKNAELLHNYLENNGYFYSKVDGKIIDEKKQTIAIYEVNLRKQWLIDSVFMNQNLNKNTFKNYDLNIKKDNPYNLQTFKDERENIDKWLKSRGFYNFKPEYLIFSIDSLQKKSKLVIRLDLIDDLPNDALLKTRIHQVNVYPNYHSNTNQNLTFYRGINIADSAITFRKKIIRNSIGFQEGSIYNNEVQEQTLTRLISMNNFKFIRPKFDKINDSTLNLNYFLTPYKKNSIRLEGNGVTKTNDLNGLQFNLNWRNRNLFGGAETFLTNLGGWSDLRKKTDSTYRASRIGLSASLQVPRLFIPSFIFKTTNNTAKSNINFGYERFSKVGLYKLTSLKTSLGYQWKNSRNVEFIFNPISINYVKPTLIDSEKFVDLIFQNPAALQVLESLDLILGGDFSFNYSTFSPAKKSYYTIHAGVEMAGNLPTLLARTFKKDTFELFGIRYSQFFKPEIDFRHYNNLTKKLQWANRAFVGFGFAYGNSLQLPFFKQYFAGGNNSLRGFRAREIGPGLYQRKGTIFEEFIGNQTGDIKMEFNSELRYKFTPLLNFAAFTDIGNIWMYKNAENYGEEALFTNNFYKQFAVTGGLGIRLDFTYLVARFDIGMPLRKPFRISNEVDAKHNGWVLNEISLGNKSWRKENLQPYFAIGFPF
jgi:outer membrane protein assembly factor BamA